MKRWALVPLGAVLMMTAGCITPPVGWDPPEISAIEVSPAPVTAGSDFTVTADVVDDFRVTAVTVGFVLPGLEEFRGTTALVPCTHAQGPGIAGEGNGVVFLDRPKTVSVDFTCSMPAYAPNGLWRVVLSAMDGQISPIGGACGCGRASANLAVTGGSEDHEPPVVDSAVLDPATPVVGQPFTVTMRISDEHLSTPTSEYGLTTHAYIDQPEQALCLMTSWTLVTPTLGEAVFSCPPHPNAAQHTSWANGRDLNGYFAYLSVDFEVVAAP